MPLSRVQRAVLQLLRSLCPEVQPSLEEETKHAKASAGDCAMMKNDKAVCSPAQNALKEHISVTIIFLLDMPACVEAAGPAGVGRTASKVRFLPHSTVTNSRKSVDVDASTSKRRRGVPRPSPRRQWQISTRGFFASRKESRGLPRA